MIKEGKSDKEIVDFMVERYGEFILYRPRLNSSTLLLWGAPVFLLIAGIILLLVIVRKRRTLDLASGESGLSAEERARLTDLLNNTQDSTSHTNKQEKQ
jgi:cytochrome c-type biogenesis protein CcmH